MAALFMLGIFAPRGQVAPRYHPIVINTYDWPRHAGYELTPPPLTFWHGLTDDQVAAALPGFDQFAIITSARAEYEADSWLNYVLVVIEWPDKPNNRATITLTKDAIRGAEAYSSELSGFTISDVHGVHVVARCADPYAGRSSCGLYIFSAIFLLNGIIYRITLQDYKPASLEYNEYLEMLVNEIILTSVKAGLTADLSVLDNPEVPELRDEQLTLAQACADPDFGAYVPEKFPDSLAVEHARRYLNQTRNYLNIIGQPNGFSAGFWTVSEPTAYDFNKIVSIEEREKYDVSLYPEARWALTVPSEYWQAFQCPIFRAEDMSFETVLARVHEGNVQGFGVLIDDVVVEIASYNVTPEQAWEMLEQVLAQANLAPF